MKSRGLFRSSLKQIYFSSIIWENTLPKPPAEHLFEFIMRRHQDKSTIITWNRLLEELGELLGDVPATSANLDRFLATAEVVKITGRSYRVKGIIGNKDQGDGTK